MSSPDASPDAYVVAAAGLVAMPLDGERRAAVTAVFARIASFAADVKSIDVGNEIEIAGSE